MNRFQISKKEKSTIACSKMLGDYFIKENLFSAIISGICISALLFCSLLEASAADTAFSEATKSANVKQKYYFIDRFGNQTLTSLKGIGSIYSNLTLLHVSGSNITSLKEIDELPNLLELHIINEKLTSLEGIERVPNLQKLDLSNNLLTSLDGIEQLSGLQELNLSNNQVAELGRIKQLSNLQKLDLSNNLLTSLDGIEQLSELQELNLSNNQVSFSELEKIKPLFNLQLVNIAGNAEISQTRMLFFSLNLPDCTFTINGKSYKNGKEIKEISQE